VFGYDEQCGDSTFGSGGLLVKTLILTGEVSRDGKLRVELPEGTLPGPVEVTLRPLTSEPPAQEDWYQFLLSARARMEAAGCRFMNDAEVQAYIEELREDDDRLVAAYGAVAEQGRPQGG
jgi:hypothetical protein